MTNNGNQTYWFLKVGDMHHLPQGKAEHRLFLEVNKALNHAKGDDVYERRQYP